MTVKLLSDPDVTDMVVLQKGNRTSVIICCCKFNGGGLNPINPPSGYACCYTAVWNLWGKLLFWYFSILNI